MYIQQRFWWQQIPSPIISEILCNTEFDGVVLDLEHGCFNNETVAHCIQVIQGKGKAAYVRIQKSYKPALDIFVHAGVDGVVFADIPELKLDEEVETGYGLDVGNMWGLREEKKIVTIGQIERPIRRVYNQYDYYMITPIDFFKRGGTKKDMDMILDVLPVPERACHVIDGHPQAYDAEWCAFGVDAMMLMEGMKKYV